MLRMHPLALAIGLAWGLNPLLAAAQNETDTNWAPSPEATRLREVTVSATRTERQTDDVPATVTVLTREKIERKGARDLKDLLSDEIDLSVRAAPARFTAAFSSVGRAGNEGINIRGLEGNQVLMTVDGIRVPNAFSFGAFATGRGDYLETSALQSVEVLRGPASTQYGSDGLAGAVSFRTLEPSDVLKGQERLGGFVRSGYADIDRSVANALALAGRNERWQAVLLGSYRRGHETANMGQDHSLNDARTAPNPLAYDSGYLLGKAYYSLNSAHRFGLSVEALHRKQDAQVYSGRATPPLRPTSVIGLDARDKVERERVALEHRYADPNGAWVQRAETRLYGQSAQVEQFTAEDRLGAPDRTRDNLYRTRAVGLSSQFESNTTGAINQRLSYGFDYSRSRMSALREGTTPPPGERFPSKPFPDTTYTLAGAFVQSEIELGALSLIPGLRYDHYALKPSANGYPGPLTQLSDQALSPRLGVVWRLSPALAPYAQWARGFRAPTPEQVNNGFSNPVMGYTSIGNPNLKAERANSLEIGLRGTLADALRYALAVYDNRYDDFISQAQIGGSGRPGDPIVFQHINLAKARIKGAEARAQWTIGKRWTLNAGIAWAKGDSESGGVKAPLETVNPLKAVLGLRYDDVRWGMQARLTHGAQKSANSVNPVIGGGHATNAPASAPAFTPAAYTVLDAGAYWKPMRKLTLSAHIGNLFNTKYWRWSDARGLAANTPVPDAYTAPGRNFQIALKYDF